MKISCDRRRRGMCKKPSHITVPLKCIFSIKLKTYLFDMWVMWLSADSSSRYRRHVGVERKFSWCIFVEYCLQLYTTFLHKKFHIFANIFAERRNVHFCLLQWILRKVTKSLKKQGNKKQKIYAVWKRFRMDSIYRILYHYVLLSLLFLTYHSWDWLVERRMKRDPVPPVAFLHFIPRGDSARNRFFTQNNHSYLIQ